jgi:hypothetical protein
LCACDVFPFTCYFMVVLFLSRVYGLECGLMKAGSESFYPFPRAWFLSCCLSCFTGSMGRFLLP